VKIIFIGCVHSSERFLKAVLSVKEIEVVGIVTKEKSSFNSDFISLLPYAKENNIDYFLPNSKSNDDYIKWIESKAPDLIYCFGWSSLLPNDILKLPKLGTVGYHPTLLPCNRGRHPIIWALALGLESTGSSFFFMDEEPDHGDILSQEVVSISTKDDAESLYRKLLDIGEKQVVKFTKSFVDNSFSRNSQDHSLANSWRKRGMKDGEIDWRMSAESIYNLVRALAKPYPGAHFFYDHKVYNVWKCEIIENKEVNLEAGKVLEVKSDSFTVKCGVNALKVLNFSELSLVEGEYL